MLTLCYVTSVAIKIHFIDALFCCVLIFYHICLVHAHHLGVMSVIVSDIYKEQFQERTHQWLSQPKPVE